MDDEFTDDTQAVVRDKWGRTPTECWAQGDVFRLVGSTVDGVPLVPEP